MMSMEAWLLALVLLNLVVAVLLFLRLTRLDDHAEIVRESLRIGRREAADDFRSLREELLHMQQNSLQGVTRSIAELQDGQRAGMEQQGERVEKLRNQMDAALRTQQADHSQHMERLKTMVEAQLATLSGEQKHYAETLEARLRTIADGNEQRLNALRETLEKSQRDGNSAAQSSLHELGKQQHTAMTAVETRIREWMDGNTSYLESFRQNIEKRIAAMQTTHEQRITGLHQGIEKSIADMSALQRRNAEAMETRMSGIATANEQRLEQLRLTVDGQMSSLQTSNEKKLEQMRLTVDEKLQSTLEKRLGESFKLVSDQLEAVQQGIGSMKSLTEGVGDLKRMLTNVKTRGTWGEVQLGAILEQILTSDQYSSNVQPRPSSANIVEYAVRLPGQGDVAQVWLPIDAKFPQEDYMRLLDAAERADSDGVEKSTAALSRAIQAAAKDISEKYLEPPYTTDFAIMFLPTEGLYSEVLRQPGMVEAMQQQYRIVIAGPTTLSAILNSLRMGFRTLAIEKRSSEVWKILAVVKSEFGKFGAVLDKVKKQLDTASNSIDQTGVRTRAIERSLRNVEELPDGDSSSMLGLSLPAASPDEDGKAER